MTKANGARRVVVTGMGAVTPIGLDVDEFWTSIKKGRCGVSASRTGRSTTCTSTSRARSKASIRPSTSRAARSSTASATPGSPAAPPTRRGQAGLPTPYDEPYRAACIIGSGAGGHSTIELAYRDLFIHNKRATNPLTLLRIIGSRPAHVGIEYGIRGPTFATCSACSTATHAIGLVLDYIRHGVVDVGVAGASEAVLTYGSMRTWQAMRVLARGLLPVLQERNGTVLRRAPASWCSRSSSTPRRAGRRSWPRSRASACRRTPRTWSTRTSKAEVGDADGARRRRPRAGRHRLPQRARHRDRAQRPQRDERDQAGLRRSGAQARHLLDQVDARASARRRRRRGGDRLHQGDRGGLHPADDRSQRSDPQDLDYVPNAGRPAKLRQRDVELVRVRRPQRRARVRPPPA